MPPGSPPPNHRQDGLTRPPPNAQAKLPGPPAMNVEVRKPVWRPSSRATAGSARLLFQTLVLALGHGPNPFQRQFGPQILIEVVVVLQNLVNQCILVPKPDAKELPGCFLFDGTFEPAPRDEKALFGVDVLHGADELINR